jgi:xanthine dehydrogenase accessory factor
MDRRANNTVVVRGGGDLATGVIQKLWRAGYAVVALEIKNPTAIRRAVALSDAVTHGTKQVEDIRARLCTLKEIKRVLDGGEVPLLIDPEGAAIAALHPLCVVDAIMAKRNLGTSKEAAPITIAMGPGFSAPGDVDAVIETMRGHDLGRLITDGFALPNTGEPGEIGGRRDRVLRAPSGGVVRHIRAIGDVVAKGEPLFTVGGVELRAPFDGLLRGLIEDGFDAKEGMKVADLDPRREERQNCFTISDKARCLGGAVLEALLYFRRIKNL